MWEKIQDLRVRFDEIEAQMATQEVAVNPARLQELAKERAHLEPLMALLEDYGKASDNLTQAKEVVEESDDAELKELAQAEVDELTEHINELEERAKRALLPKDPNDERNVIIEIRAGTGGDEATLFTSDIFRMYSRYAENRGWRAEIMSSSPTGVGGFKEMILLIEGKGVYSRMKYESGVHRVQRVPATESSGRIHTSAVTVAVLPEADEVEVAINEKDLRIDTFCSSGPGGQSVNTTYSAVRITHLPTGLVVSCQDEKSQIKNRAQALRVLRSRLYELELEKQQQAVADERRSMVGSGDRSGKMRTYNYPQNRVTDHRIGLTLHRLEAITSGDLDELIDALFTHFQAERLKKELVA